MEIKGLVDGEMKTGVIRGDSEGKNAEFYELSDEQMRDLKNLHSDFSERPKSRKDKGGTKGNKMSEGFRFSEKEEKMYDCCLGGKEYVGRRVNGVMVYDEDPPSPAAHCYPRNQHTPEEHIKMAIRLKEADIEVMQNEIEILKKLLP
jgi:hypothetical protein